MSEGQGVYDFVSKGEGKNQILALEVVTVPDDPDGFETHFFVPTVAGQIPENIASAVQALRSLAEVLEARLTIDDELEELTGGTL